MPMGDKRAGDLLIDQAARDVVDRANVIYAALFCYRQAIELFLNAYHRSTRIDWAIYGNGSWALSTNANAANRLA